MTEKIPGKMSKTTVQKPKATYILRKDAMNKVKIT